MNITIHRGTDQIGGCVTECEYNGWRLFVDYGEQLPGYAVTSLQVEGLTHGDLSKSALLITHYHGDHVGCIADLPEELPIYIGQTAKGILEGLSEHIGYVDKKQKALNIRLKSVNTFTPGVSIEWGEFHIMPVLMDHSAFDAYAFCIEAGGLKVFHTGDFRTHGFRSSKLPQVIEKYVGRVDYLVCEATNVCRPVAGIIPEYELQTEFVKAFAENKYNVVYLSSTNIDRLFGLYHAALKTGRPFYVDGYQKKIMDIVAGRDRIWGKSRLYRYKEGREPIVLHRDGDDFRVNDKFRDNLSENGYVIIARGGRRFDSLLSRIPSEGRKTYFSMWRGYLNKSNAAYSPELAQSVSVNYEYLHTSGHCDMESLDWLFSTLSPRAIIPIHTDNPQAFADLFCDQRPVLLMKDGETFSPIRDPGYDNITANVYALKPLEENIAVVDNPENLPVWSLDERCLGEFRREEDAMWALKHCVYALGRLLAYSVEANEDMYPWIYRVYATDFSELALFSYGGHEPGGEHFQEASQWKPGDKVLGVYYDTYNVVVPCEVIGPVNEDFLRRSFEADEFNFANSYEDWVKEFNDWNWDTVVVRPLVKLTNYLEPMPDEIDLQRIYLFPWKQ